MLEAILNPCLMPFMTRRANILSGWEASCLSQYSGCSGVVIVLRLSGRLATPVILWHWSMAANLLPNGCPLCGLPGNKETRVRVKRKRKYMERKEQRKERCGRKV